MWEMFIKALTEAADRKGVVLSLAVSADTYKCMVDDDMLEYSWEEGKRVMRVMGLPLKIDDRAPQGFVGFNNQEGVIWIRVISLLKKP